MKKILLSLILLGTFTGFSQVITVNPTANTPVQLSQLVNNVLVNNSCLVQISNITAKTGTTFGSTNGIAQYQNTNPAFNVKQNGVLLTTGQAQLSPGPNNSTLNGGNTSTTWVGDAGLEAALASAGITMQSKNATVLEFDFVPNTSNFGFDFLFASDEYGAFQCESNDAFVVLLTQTVSGVTQNVAVVPSTNTPVTVSTIRNILYNSACPSANASFFGSLNVGGNAATSPTNYNGQTTLMHATATVTPNVTYHLRFVIADDAGADGTDGDYDSAVFIPAGTLNLGQKLFAQDLTVANGTALCFGQQYTINTNLDPDVYQFSWTRNGGAPIAGQTGPSLVVTTPGDYAVTLTRADLACTTTQTIKIEYKPEIMAPAASNLLKCDNGSGTYTYDLTVNTPILKQGLDPATVVTYHATQTNANDDTGALPTTYISSSGATIWARVEIPDGCAALRSFQLLTSAPPTATQPQNLTLCESSQGANNAVFDLTQQNFVVLNGQSNTENQISYFTSLPAAQLGTSPIITPESFTGTSQTIYVRVQKTGDTSCYAITQFDLIVKPLVVLPAPATVNSCNSYTLPAVAGANYYTGSGGTGTMYTAGTVISVSQLLYIFAQTGGTPNCSNQSTVDINIINAATAPADVTACQSYTLPALTIGQYRDAPAGGGNEIVAGTVITATQTIFYFIPSAAACTQNNSFTVTITTNPVVTQPANVNSCGPYTLPALPNGENYYTATNGGGTVLAAGSQVTTSQTIYVYTTNPSNPACTAQSSFTVTITNINIGAPRPDRVVCGSYVLPTITVGKYYTLPNGGGTQLNNGASITTNQTIYVYAVSPSDPNCFAQDDFTVTINALPNIPPKANVTACNSYTLPTMPVGSYYTLPNGGGSVLPAGTAITATQTIYAYAITPEGCSRQRTFTVTILNLSGVNPGNQTACGSYQLPALSIGSYYTQPNGAGTQLQPGANITSSQTIYIRAVSNTTPVCAVEESFVVTIVPRPVVASIPNVISCNSYTLPAVPVANGNYYTGNDGTGTLLPPGTVLTNSQIVRFWVENPLLAGCGTQRNFTVTIINTDNAPADVTACESYTLQALPANRFYRTAAAGGGTQIPVGTVITTSQTVYVYSPVTSGTNCSDDDSFDITILPQVLVDDPADIQSCNSYTLPVLTNGDYYTGPGGTGTIIPDGTVISSTQMIYVYNSSNTGVNCSAENSFLVDILDITVTDLPDVTVCDGFILPELTVGKYYTATNGGGTEIPAGTLITTSQTIFIYAATTTAPICTDEESFAVTIKPAPPIDTPANVGSCGPYTLPALAAGNYFTGPGGGGTALFAGQVISETTPLYIFAQSGGTPNCVAEHAFTVFINPGAPADVAVCDSYTLPVPDVGTYHTAPAGGGTVLNPGDVINTTQDVYVYIPSSGPTNCTDNNKFTVTINNSPVIAPVSDLSRCDFYELPVITVGEYRTAAGGAGTVLPAGHMVTSTETIYIYAASGTSPDCISEASFVVTIVPTPIVDARSDEPACFSFTLQPLIVGKYYANSGGPGPTNPEIPAGTVITATQTLYIYADSGIVPACPNENSFTIEIFDIDVDQVPNATVCDSYTFQPLTVGKYYANAGGPSPSNPEILPATVWTTPGVKTFYVYGETVGRLNCPDEKSFTVTLYQTPVIDETQGNVAQCTPFTLPPMAAGTVGKYYNGPNGTGGELPAGTVLTAPQTVYVYAANGPAANCFKQHSFNVDVNIVDVTAPADITICGVYTLPALTQGNYYTQPNGGGTQLAVGTQITSTQTIYVWRSAGSVPCTDQDDFTVTIITAPQIIQPDPLVVCGIDDAGHGIFNLNPALAQALGGQANTAVSIYETSAQANAVNGTPITNLNAYTNIEAYNQTLYIRVQSTVSNCFSIVTVQLTVNDRPIATEPDDLEVCDGADGDGSAIFKLTDVNAQVLGSMSPAQFSVTFHVDAQATTSAIPNPNSYNSPTATIYVKVTNNATGCYDVVPLNLVVNPLPVANTPTPYTLCDNTDPQLNNEREVFNLNSKIAEITGGATGINVTFHTSINDAIDDIGAITNPTTYTNLTTVQTLFVRVENAVTNCYRVVLMDIRVEPLPLLVMPTAAETTICDPDGDGFAQFDLQALINDMLNGGTNIQVTFHETPEDAVAGLNAIPNLTSYPNEFPDQKLYIRAVNTLTGCISTRPNDFIVLHVNPSPQVPDLNDILVCDTDSNVNGQTIINLTQQNATIQAALGNTVTIQYFTSLLNAQTGAPRITNPSTYLGSDGQEIWVRVTDVQGCFGIESFFLNIDVPLVLTSPTPLTLCDNTDQPNDGIREFDLTTKENEILGPFGVGQGFVLTYFVKNTNQPNINPIANPGSFTQITNPAAYTNTLNPQTLFVIATSPGGCKSFTTLTIRVLPNPVPDMTPDTLELCDDNNSPDGLESFNLTLAAADIRDGDNSTLLTYYTTAALAEAGVAGTEIPNPAAHVSGTGNVYVRVQANTGNPADPGCYRVVTLPLVVNPLPVLGTGGVIPVYAICEIPFDGFAQFTLNSHIPKILVGQNAADYTVRFFETLAAAQAGTPAMPNIHTNNPANSQFIFVRVDNNTTDCTAIAQMELRVEPGATATLPNSTPYQVCDTDPVNDGKFQFDLTQVAPQVLNGQSPTQFLITYHESLADAEDGLNPIATPATYVNTTADAQTIYVRVVNSITLTPCDAITTIDIIVERLPEPVITSTDGSDTICVEFFTGTVNSSVTLQTNITGAGYTYQWFRNVTTQVGTGATYTATEEGDYTVIVTGPSPRNCPSLPSAKFTVIKSGPAAIPAGQTGFTVTNAFSDTQTITINIVGFGDYRYQLGNGPLQTSNVFTNVPFGEQTVTVYDVKTENPSCAQLELEVSIIDYPNFFTPNGDGYNDKWNIVGLGSSNNNSDAKIYIFDRYGKLVKQISSEGDGWDGTFAGNIMPADDYWFTVEYKEMVDGVEVQKEFKSHFSLKR